MVIGNGMIAKRFRDYSNRDDIIIFASGVSNSSNTKPEVFERETALITKTLENNKGKLFVYFSTCSISNRSQQGNAYTQHKQKIEKQIIAHHSPYLIFRLTNPVGNTANTNTVVNYFINNIIEQHKFELWQNATRNIIDIDDMYIICHEIIQQKLFSNSIVHIANPHNYTVPFIVETIEKHFGLKGNYSLINKGDSPVIDISLIQPLLQKFNINFDEDYLSEILQKYFPQ